MKVKFIAPEKTKEFRDGQILEATYPANGNTKMLVIKNAQNEHCIVLYALIILTME